MGDRGRFIYLDSNVPVENKAPEGESDMGLYGVLFYLRDIHCGIHITKYQEVNNQFMWFICFN